ncbi:MAG: arginine repressor [Acetanaerobacterium sp.]
MKTKRHAKILELVSEGAINTQEELLSRLREDGFNVTQATVSRDIKELKLIKALGENGSYRYAVTAREKDLEMQYSFNNLFVKSVISMDYAGNVVCVKCYTGMANAACAAFDSLEWQGIVGTIAGDDTMFILTRSEQTAAQLKKELMRQIEQE